MKKIKAKPSQTKHQALVIGTGNKDKAKELKSLLKGMNVRIIPISKFKDVPEVVEDGKTFKANASKKARVYSKLSDHLTLADDSGLCVQALKGAPGVYSARYAGPDCSYDDNNKKLIKALKGKPKSKRKAYFCSTIALYLKGKPIHVLQGKCHGHITESLTGKKGFGFDPVFIPEGHNKTFADMSPTQKNKISHRGKALQATREFLATYF